MAQQNTTPTLTNLNSATSVSPLDRESSPKNDISCLALLNARRAIKRAHSLSYVVKKVRLAKERLSQKEKQKRIAIAELKQSTLYPCIQKLIGEKRCFTFKEVEQLSLSLCESGLDCWTVVMVGSALSHGAVVFAHYNSIAPALAFRATENGYQLTSFHFNYLDKKKA
ncbi:hypothetical protein ACUYPW_004523 [Vibrio vulnificus]